MMSNNTENPSFEIAKQIFGDYPEDVISPIKSASDALSWLEQLFKTIEKEALDERGGFRIKELAAMGAYLAFDMSNYAGCMHETYTERLKSGYKKGEANRV